MHTEGEHTMQRREAHWYPYYREGVAALVRTTEWVARDYSQTSAWYTAGTPILRVDGIPYRLTQEQYRLCVRLGGMVYIPQEYRTGEGWVVFGSECAWVRYSRDTLGGMPMCDEVAASYSYDKAEREAFERDATAYAEEEYRRMLNAKSEAVAWANEYSAYFAGEEE